MTVIRLSGKPLSLLPSDSFSGTGVHRVGRALLDGWWEALGHFPKEHVSALKVHGLKQGWLRSLRGQQKDILSVLEMYEIPTAHIFLLLES